jgi:uncharacterized membrane protein HdeD (DUF308 family)
MLKTKSSIIMLVAAIIMIVSGIICSITYWISPSALWPSIGVTNILAGVAFLVFALTEKDKSGTKTK